MSICENRPILFLAFVTYYVFVVMQCKKYHYKGNIIMETGYGRPYKKEDSVAQRFVPLMRFKCMNLEPLNFVFRGEWTGSTV